MECLTTGAPGVSLLAASYATERGLVVSALVPDFHRVPVDALARRDTVLVGEADAAVVVWDERPPNMRRVLALVTGRRSPGHIVRDW